MSERAVIVDYSKNDLIRGHVDRLGFLTQRTKERSDFLQKQMDRLKEEHSDERKKIWREIEDEIDRQGLLKPGEKAVDVDMELDRDVTAIRRNDKSLQIESFFKHLGLM